MTYAWRDACFFCVRRFNRRSTVRPEPLQVAHGVRLLHAKGMYILPLGVRLKTSPKYSRRISWPGLSMSSCQSSLLSSKRIAFKLNPCSTVVMVSPFQPIGRCIPSFYSNAFNLQLRSRLTLVVMLRVALPVSRLLALVAFPQVIGNSDIPLVRLRIIRKV